MPALPDDLRTLTPEQLLYAYARQSGKPGRQRTALRTELLRRLRLVPVPDTPESVAAKFQAVARLIDRAYRHQGEGD